MVEENRETTSSRRRPLSRFRRALEKLKGGITFSLVFSITVHVAMIVIGSMNIYKCPVERNIPIYLVAAGVIGIVSKILGLARNFILRYMRVAPILSFVGTAELAYFICGSYWVYKEYKPNYDPASGEHYCNKTAYIFALVYISIIYAFMVLAIICILLFLLVACICIKKTGDSIRDAIQQELDAEKAEKATACKEAPKAESDVTKKTTVN